MTLQEKFSAAVNVINSLPSDGAFQPSEDLMLKLYAYYKQSTVGPCNIAKPSVWYYSARIKWTAWNELGDMPKEDAMAKYIEELTKVIETMSYNETVSRFMSLIGPFYEIVSTDEIDQQCDKKLNNAKHSEFSYPVKNLDDLHNFQADSLLLSAMEQTDSPASEEISFSCSSESVNKHNENSSNLCKCDSYADFQSFNFQNQQKVVDIFKPKATCLKKQQFISHQDMLILTIINLQSSLENIVQKLDELQTLAKTANFNYKVEADDCQYKDWTLNVPSTVLALIWPFAVHLCTRIC